MGPVVSIAIAAIPKLVEVYLAIKDSNRELTDEEITQKVVESETFAQITHTRVQNID